MKGLKEAKSILEDNGYQREIVYKLSYLKDGTWKHIYFEDKEEAEMMMCKMVEINKEAEVYRHISINKYSWEMLIEP